MNGIIDPPQPSAPTDNSTAHQSVQNMPEEPHYNGSNVLKGALSGLASGGPMTGLLGGVLGLTSSMVEFQQNKKLYKQQLADSRENATIDYQRQKELLARSQSWNSEQAQVNRLIASGLNPALAYGQMSSSSVSSPSSSQAQTPSANPLDLKNLDALGILNLILQNKLGAATIDNKNADTQGQNIENAYKEQQIIGDLNEQIARITEIITKANLNEETKNQMLATRDSLIRLQNANALQAEEHAKYTSGALTAKTEQDVKTAKSQESLNYTENKFIKGPKTENTQEDTNLKHQQSYKTKGEAYEVFQRFGLKRDQQKALKQFMIKKGLNPSYSPLVMESLQNFAQSTGKTIPEVIGRVLESWSRGDTWLNYLSSEHRTQVLGNREQTENGKPAENPKPAARIPDGGHYGPKQQARIDQARKLFHKLTPDQQRAYFEWRDKAKPTPLEMADKILQYLR